MAATIPEFPLKMSMPVSSFSQWVTDLDEVHTQCSENSWSAYLFPFQWLRRQWHSVNCLRKAVCLTSTLTTIIFWAARIFSDNDKLRALHEADRFRGTLSAFANLETIYKEQRTDILFLLYLYTCCILKHLLASEPHKVIISTDEQH